MSAGDHNFQVFFKFYDIVEFVYIHAMVRGQIKDIATCTLAHHPSFQGFAFRCPLVHVYIYMYVCLSGLWLGGLGYLTFFFLFS